MLKIELDSSYAPLIFEKSELEFTKTDISDIFVNKNNKTLGQTLMHRRYASLMSAVHERYSNCMDQALGDFLMNLKKFGDPFYRQFLNSYGDEIFCEFRMMNERHKSKKGLYLYSCGSIIKYIGRSLDPFSRRIDRGYGKIHPKNCYKDGQSTNCHLNSLIELNRSFVTFYVCPLIDNDLIERAERELIQVLRPDWNTALLPGRPKIIGGDPHEPRPLQMADSSKRSNKDEPGVGNLGCNGIMGT